MRTAILFVSLLLVFSGNATAQQDHSMHKTSANTQKVIYDGKVKGLGVKVILVDNLLSMKAHGIDTSKINKNLTHHFKVMLTGDIITSAKAAISYKGKAIGYRLMGMGDHFGSDIMAKEKGKYDAALTIDTAKNGAVELNLKFEP